MSRLSSFSLWSRSCIGRKAGRDAGFQTRPSRLPGAHLPASLKGFGGAALHLLISSPEAAWGAGGGREEGGATFFPPLPLPVALGAYLSELPPPRF